MRESLTVLAAILVLCLSVALAAPYFIDWNAQRSLVETHLSKALGEKVSIHGNLDLKLLPTPYLHLQKIDILDEAASAHLTAEDVFLEIAIPPLLRGEVDFIEARVRGPHFKLMQAGDGTLQVPQPVGFSGQARFERISIEDAKIELADPAQSRALILDHLDLNAEANSLAGPFKGDGNGVIAGEKTAFRFSTGAREGDNLRLKLIVDQSKTHPRADIDGALSFGQRQPGHVAVSFTGNAAFSGIWQSTSATGDMSLPWRLSGPLRLASNKATMETLEARLGDEDHAVNANGSAELDFSAAPKASLSLRARQVDLDRLMTDPNGSESLSQSLAHLTNAVGLSTFPLPVALDATAETATLNGDTLTDLSGALLFDADKPLGLRFEGGLPGRSHLRLDGNFEAGSAKQFNGKVDANFGDADRLTKWLSNVSPSWADALHELPFHTIEINGTAGLSQVGFSGRDLRVRLDHSAFLGNISYTQSVGTEAARLFVDASSPSLDLEGWPNLQQAAQLTQATDLSIRFEARSVKLGGLRKGAVDTGEMRIKLTKTGANTKIEEFTLKSPGNAAIAANGAWNGEAGSLDAKLNVPRLGDVTAFLQHFTPSAWLDLINDRAALLSPLQLDVHAEAAKSETASLPALTALTLKGMAGATSLKADVKTSGSSLLTATIDAPDSVALLNQFGAHVLPLNGLGRGHIEIKAQGALDHSPDTMVQATVAGLNLSFRGHVETPMPNAAPGFAANGQLHLASADVSPLLQATGLAFPDLTTRLPADLTSTLDWSAARLDLRDLQGTFANTPLSGFLNYAPQGDAKKLTGALDLDKTSAAALLELVLGPPQPAKGGSLWSNLSFGTGLPDPPAASLTLHAKTLDLLPGLSGENAAAQIEVTPGVFTLRDVTMRTGGGTAAGTFTLRRDGATATLSGHLSLDNYGLNLPSLQARASVIVDMSGSGSTPLALMSSLAGNGHASFADFTIRHADAGALSRVFADVEHDKLSVDETEIDRALGREFDRGNLTIGTQALDLSLATGVMRLTSVTPPQPAASPVSIDELALSLDLRNGAITQRTGLTLLALPKDWQGGPAPHIALNFKGALTNPARSIESAGFVNTLAARAIAREAARIQAYEFDLHERAVFNQRLQLERRRDAELKAEEDARRAAEAARKAEEAARLEKIRKAEEARKEELRKKQEEPLQLNPQLQQTPNSKPSNAAQSPPAAAPADPSALGRY